MPLAYQIVRQSTNQFFARPSAGSGSVADRDWYFACNVEAAEVFGLKSFLKREREQSAVHFDAAF
jgi:hypothetical protein